ncbi:hypothetical protein [Thiospirillum jenense]|uniref:Uncharacterized protein n=1 Tax=Thiospirillum jenense TaxID=1653858 RepID=A0A839H2N3_9GAMM|nr:hypothetical protein [Thiospirillum jenense]MBB1124733.1 hypothetical protein [Thiospirillum jenense]
MIYNGIKRRANTVKVTTEVRRGRDWKYAQMLMQMRCEAGHSSARRSGALMTGVERRFINSIPPTEQGC